MKYKSHIWLWYFYQFDTFLHFSMNWKISIYMNEKKLQIYLQQLFLTWKVWKLCGWYQRLSGTQLHQVFYILNSFLANNSRMQVHISLTHIHFTLPNDCFYIAPFSVRKTQVYVCTNQCNFFLSNYISGSELLPWRLDLPGNSSVGKTENINNFYNVLTLLWATIARQCVSIRVITLSSLLGWGF